MKLVVDLNEFNIIFKIRVAIKGKALAKFVVELANVPEMEE